MMQEAIAAAAEHVLALPNHRSLRPDTFKREGIALVLVAIALVAMGAFLPRVVFTILPRFAFPYADFPPYNATSITVEPAGAAVDYGESLRVAAQMKGPMPRNVSLVLRDLKGRELSESPMFDAGDGLFFQTIENIQDDIEYFVRIPRGRSKRFRVAVTKLPRIVIQSKIVCRRGNDLHVAFLNKIEAGFLKYTGFDIVLDDI